MTILKLLEDILLMERTVEVFQETVEGYIDAAVMALIIGVVLDTIEITPCLVLILLRVTTDRTPTVV